ncbi:aldolase/citrate lyase family protein [Citricoccus sp. NPDC055426]|uniref:HpcH/HpaI aldolase family protein n=1 Tax=Citricoccus sp. NPDC055426 TaxID=3155536 RepID=UPI0034454B1A
MFPHNRTKQLLHEDKPALGIEFMTESHKLIEISGWAGFDFIQFDMEHTAYSFSEIEGFVRTAEGVGLTPIVRVAELGSSNIRRVLETGAQGLIVPQVRTAQDVEEALQAMRYAPGGTRGMCTITRAARYNEQTWDEYLRWIDEQLMFIPIIENEEALRNVHEILAVPGIDAVSFGAGDMGQALGAGADGLADERVREALFIVREAARANNVPLKAMPVIGEGTEESIRDHIDHGVRLLTYDADALMFARLAQQAVASSRQVFDQAASLTLGKA